MRAGILVVGIVLIVIGGVLSFMPLLSAGACASPCGAIDVQSKSLVVDSHFSVSWSGGGSSDYVAAIDCGTTQPTAISSVATTPAQVCSGGTVVSSGTGSSGTLSVAAPNGDWIVVGAWTSSAATSIDTSAALSATATEGLIGIPILILGVIFLILGAALKSKKQKQVAQAPPQAWGPGPGASPGQYPPQQWQQGPPPQ